MIARVIGVVAIGLLGATVGCANVLDYDDVAFESAGEWQDAGASDAGVDRERSDARADAAQESSVADVRDAGLDRGDASMGDVSADPCDQVDCGPHGTCEPQAGEAACSCDDGYHAEGLTCEEDVPPDPCEGVVCGAHASCQAGVCECDDGYEGDPTAGCSEPNSVEDQVRAELVDIAMAELGYCEGVDDRPYMQSQPGYWCYDFVAWVYSQCSHPLPAPMSLPEYEPGSLPAGWRPEPGDLIKFNIQHYGMVAEVSTDGSYITTIEGNVNSCVATRATTDASVEYYGSLDHCF